ncbi:hypothetical protein QKT49_gp426 [Acanthamoeba castellanii medusavirus]|uniref:Uncharacterized protein n=1 Tax=Acanthamoeba castellanii medusavirus J1 TaxID=3114988 RepID=A0A3T1CWX6_9VIRU|nr:hypothetical protein QKT49_gp426 [Acanthamoeba castellanii medusavirus]BBI30337.1 hypothetical protein [Acanthamoeba castellanii medusavirus J1]
MSYRKSGQLRGGRHPLAQQVAVAAKPRSSPDAGFHVTGLAVVDELVLVGGQVGPGEVPPGRKTLTIAPDGRVVYSATDSGPEDVSAIVASIGQPNGLATLDGAGQVPSTQLNDLNSRVLSIETSRGEPSGIATLDATGSVPIEQLGNVDPGLQMPTEKGVLLTSDGFVPRALSAGVDGSVLFADSTQPRGLRYGQVDHDQLLNAGVYTHDDLDALVDSRGQMFGLATLDATGNVPTVQLGNITPVTTNHETRIAVLESSEVPWNEAAWAAALNDQKSGVEIPIYRGITEGSGVPTYFINETASTDQPFAVEITLKNTRSVSLVIDPGSPTDSPIVGTYKLKPGTYSGLLLPAPAFAMRKIAAGTYTDAWSGDNPIALATATDLLAVYIGVGFPEGPTTFPPGSPFSLGYTLNNSAYLDDVSVPTQLRGWRNP